MMISMTVAASGDAEVQLGFPGCNGWVEVRKSEQQASGTPGGQAGGRTITDTRHMCSA